MKGCILSLALLTAACRQQEPPAPTAQETEQLDDADSMLNDLAKEEEPEANAPGPFNRSD